MVKNTGTNIRKGRKEQAKSLAAKGRLQADEEELRRLNRELADRVKELNCLHDFSRLTERRDISLEQIFQGLAELMPPAWDYPEIACARVVFQGRAFKTANFRRTRWVQSADVKVHKEKVGTLEVCYLKKRPERDEGPFLKEERELLEDLAERLGEVIERVQAEEELRAAHQQLAADEQQLRAANQQLMSSEQQLKAANQQLRASQQQLKAANQQLEANNQQLQANEEELRRLNRELADRVKELNCLHGFSRLTEQRDISLEQIFQGLAELMPAAWDCPEIACARVVFQGRVFKTANFRRTRWVQSADVKVHRQKVGTLEVCYLKKRPERDEGPFLKEERELLEDLAERLGETIERKQAEEALQKSQSLLNETGKMAKVGGWEFDVETLEQVWTEEVYRIHELDSHYKPTVEAGISFYAPESRPIIANAVQKAIDNGEPFDVELQFITAKGNHRWVHAIGKAHQQGGKTIKVSGTFQDITNRKKAEEVLQFERDNFINILDSMEDGVYIVDQNHDIQYVNPALKKDFGPYEERKCYDYFHDRKEVCPWCKNEEVFAGKTVQWEWYSFKNQRTYDLIDTPLRNPDGSISKLEIFRDITERKKAEQDLGLALAWQKAIFEGSRDAVFISDTDSRFVMVNSAACELTGYSKQELLGMRIPDLHEGEDLTAYNLYHDRIMSGEDIVSEAKIFRKDGTKVDTEFNNRCIKISGTAYMHTAARDITERKKAEDALRQTKEQVEKYLNIAKVMLAAVDANKKIIMINRKGCEDLKYNEGELIGRNWFELLVPKRIREDVTGIFNTLIAGKVKPVEYYENLLLTKKGEERLFSFHNTILKDSEGKINGVLFSAEDITERKKMEESLRGSEREKSAILDSMSELVVYYDSPEMKVLWTNRAAESAGQSVDQLAENYCYKICHQYDKPCEFCPVVKAFKTGQAEEAEAQSLDGMTWLIKGYPVKDEDGKVVGVVKVACDVTESKRAEEKLLEYQTRLKYLASELSLAEERQRRRIAAELHDRISQSLVIAKIKLEALRESAFSKKLAVSLKEICGSLDQTIQDTRSLTFDLGSPILYELGLEAAVAEWLAEEIQEKHPIAAEFRDDGRSKPLDSDVQAALFRMVQELLLNVVKHAQARKVNVSTESVGNEISIRVEDDGIGFSASEVALLPARKAGFGLFSIRERLEHLGGRLEIESEPGRGCRITVRAPLKEAALEKRANGDGENEKVTDEGQR